MMETDYSMSPSLYAGHTTSWTPAIETAPVSTKPSRKRSRDETAFEQAEAENPTFSAPPEPIPEEPIYGEGMVLLNPSTGRALAAESQTGTWYEDQVEKQAIAKAAEAAQRPKMPVSRKSQRISQSSIQVALNLPNSGAPASPPKSTPNTEIDEATLALGIGWTKMSSEDPDLQAAARGWARYLEENMLEGKLVGRTWESTLTNLRAQPMHFEGTEVLHATRTPGPESDIKPQQLNGWNTTDDQTVTTDGMLTNAHAATHIGMELD
ncbi:hypothetical protein LTR64_003930 [Lithohypha guttulata]|uniref:uncharacterized protein n=1 Tax=Lithohypha guttulata TaxID=1690604 RepID=UPI002DE09D9D|nr:hypothetical protein LTR51_006968 [Lithohypha guttulata]